MSPRLRYGSIALMGIAYAFLSHRMTTQAPGSVWSLATVVGPMEVFALAGLWRGGQRWLAGGLGLAAMLLLVGIGLGVVRFSTQWLYLVQHVVIHSSLGLLFGTSLRAGRQPLVTGLAQRVHRHLPAKQLRYTRQVTVAWTVYFVLMTALSMGLFIGAPLATWSLFANLLTPVALVGMFVGEYLLRYRLHPDFERVGVMAGVRAYSERSSRL
jgi:uncharacterized membrane protein